MVRRKSQFLPAFIKEGSYKDMDARRQKIIGGHLEICLPQSASGKFQLHSTKLFGNIMLAWTRQILPKKVGLLALPSVPHLTLSTWREPKPRAQMATQITSGGDCLAQDEVTSHTFSVTDSL